MNLNQLFPEFSEQTVVLTPNRRLSNFLSDKFNEWKSSQQAKAWPSLKVFPLVDWLQQLWSSNLNHNERILSNIQMDYLWQEIIAKHSETPDLLKLDATAKQAIEAMRMLVLWEVPIHSQDFSREYDWKQFYLWLEAYNTYCTNNCLTDSHHLAKRLLETLDTNSWTQHLPEKLIAFGFDELPPLWEKLLNALQPFCEIKYSNLTQTSNIKKRLEFVSWREELESMIQWAITQHNENPHQTIACVIPSLAKKRVAVEKAFIKSVKPEIFLMLKDKDEMPFNISAGQALAEFTIIHSTIQLLQLTSNELTMDTIRFILRNPFIVGYYKEYVNRSELEIRITKLQTYSLTFNSFQKQLQQYCPILASQLFKLQQINQDKEQTLIEWVELFNKKLEAWGWPGDRELSSQHFQLVLRMKESFNELLGFDSVIKQCSYQKALELLQKLLQNTIFQVKTPKQNLQILGSLEAAGMTFDKIWIMELNDKQWPAPANPNPYIPHQLQREYQLPHATAVRELKFSQTLLNRYYNSATEVYLSYSKEDDEQEYSCSTLIESIPLAKFTQESKDLMQCILETKAIEELVDSQAPTVSELELSTIQGGTNILSMQAACPFRNFALHRLNAKSIPKPEPGLTALERGKIIHAALDLFWQQVKSFTALSALTEEQKNKTISSVVFAAISSINLQMHQRTPKLFNIELARVSKLIEQWLKLELQREKFTVIATEQAIKTQFSGLPLKIRIDRIDQLENGAIVLIDYKSNITSTNRWFGERLDEPQLPLYALIYPEPVEAIIFGQIKVNEFSIKGIGSLEAQGFGVKNTADLAEANFSTWPNQIHQWQIELEKLTTNFINGQANVDPKNGAQTCAFCDLPSLCRINERNDDAK